MTLMFTPTTQEIIEEHVTAISARNRTVDGKLTSLLDVGYGTVGVDEGWEGCKMGVNGTQHDAHGTSTSPTLMRLVPRMHTQCINKSAQDVALIAVGLAQNPANLARRLNPHGNLAQLTWPAIWANSYRFSLIVSWPGGRAAGDQLEVPEHRGDGGEGPPCRRADGLVP